MAKWGQECEQAMTESSLGQEWSTRARCATTPSLVSDTQHTDLITCKSVTGMIRCHGTRSGAK